MDILVSLPEVFFNFECMEQKYGVFCTLEMYMSTVKIIVQLKALHTIPTSFLDL